MVYYALIGIDGVGKSSVHRQIKDSGIDAIFIREPYTPIREWENATGYAYEFAKLRHYLLSDLQDVKEPIISDRCFICSLAYQGYDGLSLDWLMGIQPMNLIKPDLAIWLWCDPELAAKRSKEDPIRMKHIQDWYAEALDVAGVEYVNINVTNMTKDEVFNEVMGVINAGN